MNKRTLHRLVSVLAALVMAVSLLTGCGTKTAEQVQQQDVYKRQLWTIENFNLIHAVPPLV